MESIEYSGMWWLPGMPENTVAGSLSFTEDEGVVLRLIGSFGDLENFERTKAHPLILGLSTNGKRITLTHCVAASFKMSVPGFLTEVYMGRFCFIGGHFEHPSDLRFKKVTVRYSHLADWVRTSGFSLRRYNEEPKVEVVYSLPQELKAQISTGTVSLEFAGNTTGDGIEELNIRQSVWFEIELVAGLEMQELLTDYVSPLQNLLTLATTRPNSIRELHIFSSRVYVEGDANNRVETPIQVLFRQKYSDHSTHELLVPDYMLFTLHDVFDDFQTIIEKWLQIAGELDSVCNLFFGMQYASDMYTQNKFLNVVYALESYHRRRMTNEVQSESEHHARVKAILKRVDASDEKWLKGILTYSNEPRLEQRLNDLLQRVHGVLTSVIDDDAKFAKRVKNTRNYLTHFDKRLEKKVARGSELFWMTRKLSCVLQLCLLLELGLPVQKCAKLLHRNQAFIQMAGLETQQG